jgi:heat shock protein HtpX
VQRLAAAAGMEKPPKAYVAEIDIPNAFAFGSPLTGPMVAVTRRLAESLPREEVEAVIGHELGHIRHRDVAFMMAVSIIPAIIYYIPCQRLKELGSHLSSYGSLCWEHGPS